MRKISNNNLLNHYVNNSSYNFVYPLTNRLSSYLVEHII